MVSSIFRLAIGRLKRAIRDDYPVNDTPAWMTKGKTIAELIAELRSFEDQTMEVRISVDDGMTQRPISLVTKEGGTCVPSFSDDGPTSAADR